MKNEGFDHMTIVVSDLEGAKVFFGLLGFVERIAVVAEGEAISRYMGFTDWEADHVTLALEGAPIHQEVQLLRFHRPPAAPDEGAGSLGRLGFNHVCFRVADMDAMLAHLDGARDHAAGGHLGLPRPAPRVHRRAGRRGRVGRMDEWVCRPEESRRHLA